MYKFRITTTTAEATKKAIREAQRELNEEFNKNRRASENFARGKVNRATPTKRLQTGKLVRNSGSRRTPAKDNSKQKNGSRRRASATVTSANGTSNAIVNDAIDNGDNRCPANDIEMEAINNRDANRNANGSLINIAGNSKKLHDCPFCYCDIKENRKRKNTIGCRPGNLNLALLLNKDVENLMDNGSGHIEPNAAIVNVEAGMDNIVGFVRTPPIGLNDLAEIANGAENEKNNGNEETAANAAIFNVEAGMANNAGFGRNQPFDEGLNDSAEMENSFENRMDNGNGHIEANAAIVNVEAGMDNNAGFDDSAEMENDQEMNPNFYAIDVDSDYNNEHAETNQSSMSNEDTKPLLLEIEPVLIHAPLNEEIDANVNIPFPTEYTYEETVVTINGGISCVITELSPL